MSRTRVMMGKGEGEGQWGRKRAGLWFRQVSLTRPQG